MGKFVRFLMTVVLLICLSFSVEKTVAVDKVTATLSAVKKTPKFIEFTVKANKPFPVTNNRWVLYIGKRTYTRSHNFSKDGNGLLVFYVPADEVALLQEGNLMCVSLGSMFNGKEDQIEKICADGSAPCWNLGKYTSGLIK